LGYHVGSSLEFGVSAAIVGIVAVIISLTGVLISRKGLRLKEFQSLAKTPNFELCLSATSVHRFRDERYRIFDCAIRLRNKSNADTTVEEAVLSITRSLGGVSSPLQVRHDPTPVLLADPTGQPLDLPLTVGPHEVSEGSLLFQVPDLLLIGHREDRYILTLKMSSSDQAVAVRIIMLREHEHDSLGNRTKA
jgi:hypothetical protein